jgi:fructose 1,6-bisphosphatase
MKHFCNARNTIPYIQDIKIINAFRDRVSDINIVEEIAMKKPKTVVNLLAFASRPQRLELSSLNIVTRGPQRRSSKKIRRST